MLEFKAIRPQAPAIQTDFEQNQKSFNDLKRNLREEKATLLKSLNEADLYKEIKSFLIGIIVWYEQKHL